MIVRIREYYDEDKALEAAGLRGRPGSTADPDCNEHTTV